MIEWKINETQKQAIARPNQHQSELNNEKVDFWFKIKVKLFNDFYIEREIKVRFLKFVRE